MTLGPFKYNDLAIYIITIITITIIKRDLTGFSFKYTIQDVKAKHRENLQLCKQIFINK